MSSPDCDGFVNYLMAEFQKRKTANPSYSLRAFAASLCTDVSQISKVLSGKRRVSDARIRKLGARLKIPETRISGFLEHERRRRKFPRVPARVLRFESVLDLPEKIEWQSLALLECVKLDGFQSDPAWIAREICQPEERIVRWIAALTRANLLRTVDGKLTASGQSVTYRPTEDFTAEENRAEEKRILEAAARAVDEFPLETRDQSSMLMATSSAKLQEAKRMITRFRRDLCAFLEDTEAKEAIYQLSISLFPASDMTRGKKSESRDGLIKGSLIR